MNILFIGDIFGRPGRTALKNVLPELKREFKIDFTIANIENASSGKGVTVDTYVELKKLGIDLFTSGNHIWSKKEIIPVMEDENETIIRPANFPDGTPGRGMWSGSSNGTKITVINLMGRVFMREDLEDPFRTVDQLLKGHEDEIVIIDFHAEATSEKRALGFYVDGKATAVVGTHTHVPTADAQILPHGTAYITDVGFTGPQQSILGVDKDIIIHNFITQLPEPHEVARGDAELGAVVLTIEGNKATYIQHVRRLIEL